MQKIVTRFAPSPTGHLHIGGARTAIFSWLLARHFNGSFQLRIEDTDVERSKQEYTDSILASMSWLGLDWDSDLIYQSRRFDLYSEHVDKLLENGHAYWCDCTPEQVEAMREKARSEGKKPCYNRHCRERGLGPGTGRAVRLKAPLSGQISFKDMIKGTITVDAQELDDMVIRRADGVATYNMAVVVDDAITGVTHVIRGDDHVNNTPKQILIYEGLGYKLPVFGHVPMILGPDRQKLSKRHGAKAVIDYQEDGLLPSALVNYLVRLGWSHGDQEIFTMSELVELFDGNNLNAAAAGFDPDKLQWVNAQHLHKLDQDSLATQVMPFLKKNGINSEIKEVTSKVGLFQTRASNLVDLANQLRPLLVSSDQLAYDGAAIAKTLTPEAKEHLAKLRTTFSQIAPFKEKELHDALNAYVADNGLKFKAVAPALRLSLLGFLGGPDLAAIMESLGQAETDARISKLLNT